MSHSGTVTASLPIAHLINAGSRRVTGAGTKGTKRWYALVARLAFACGEDAALPSTPTPSNDRMTLAVRIHLLQSAELDALNTTLTDAEVERLFAGVNDIWEQARIAWNVESIVREPARNATGYARLLRGESVSTSNVLLSILPTVNLLRARWNVFAVGDQAGVRRRS